jgi:ComF family protein
VQQAAELLCPECRRGLPWLDRSELCPRCALPRPCAPCPARESAFDRAYAPLAHAGPARRLVAALKFRGAVPVADLMAAQMTNATPTGALAGAVIVPVPTDPKRARRRGFDHTLFLAHSLARRTGLPLNRALARSGGGPGQRGATRRARLTPGRLGFEGRGLDGARVVLLDDVHTTGATLDAAARAAKEAGAMEVFALTYARTLRSGRIEDRRSSL